LRTPLPNHGKRWRLVSAATAGRGGGIQVRAEGFGGERRSCHPCRQLDWSASRTRRADSNVGGGVHRSRSCERGWATRGLRLYRAGRSGNGMRGRVQGMIARGGRWRKARRAEVWHRCASGEGHGVEGGGLGGEWRDAILSGGVSRVSGCRLSARAPSRFVGSATDVSPVGFNPVRSRTATVRQDSCRRVCRSVALNLSQVRLRPIAAAPLISLGKGSKAATNYQSDMLE